MSRTKAVWKDLEAVKLERWRSSRAVARTDGEEVKLLSSLGKNGGDALMLLMLFRAEHQARVLRGETFAINPKAMASCKSLHWSRERFENAKHLLLQNNFIRRVSEGRCGSAGRSSAQYTLVPRQLSVIEEAA